MKKFKNGAIFMLTVVAIFLVLYRVAFFIVSVPSASMYPTIKIGNRIVTTRIWKKDSVERGDILVFFSKELDEMMIKRVIGLPNDRINIDSTGKLFVNGVEQVEDYVAYADQKSGEYVVPEDGYFFLGDARDHSFDSRSCDNPYILEEQLEGKAQFIIYPFSNWKLLE